MRPTKKQIQEIELIVRVLNQNIRREKLAREIAKRKACAACKIYSKGYSITRCPDCGD